MFFLMSSSDSRDSLVTSSERVCFGLGKKIEARGSGQVNGAPVSNTLSSYTIWNRDIIIYDNYAFTICTYFDSILNLISISYFDFVKMYSKWIVKSVFDFDFLYITVVANSQVCQINKNVTPSYDSQFITYFVSQLVLQRKPCPPPGTFVIPMFIIAWSIRYISSLHRTSIANTSSVTCSKTIRKCSLICSDKVLSILPYISNLQKVSPFSKLKWLQKVKI